MDEQRGSRFVRSVEKVFRFLEKEHGFRLRSPIWFDPWGREPRLLVPYEKESVGIYVEMTPWSYADVFLTNTGRSRYDWMAMGAPGAFLTTLAMLRSDEKAELPLGDPWEVAPSRQSSRRDKQRLDGIRTDTEGILRTYARLLVEHAPDILQGDTRGLRAAEAYWKRKRDEYYRSLTQ